MLTLYFKPTCKFSRRVIEAATEMGVAIDMKDINADERLREELIAHGGKKQTPYLVDPERGTAMYESADIIDYLRDHYHDDAPPAPARTVHRSNETCDACE